MSKKFSLTKNKLLLSLGLNVLLFILLLLLFVPKFMTTDDLRMSFIISGNYGMLEPSDYVLFSNVLIGKLLVFLFSVFHSNSLYAFYLISLLFIANTALHYLFVKRLGLKTGSFYFFLFFVAASVFMILNLQFTIVSCFMAIVGVLYFADWNNSKEQNNLTLLVASFLLVASSLVRFDSFVLILLLSSLYFLYDFIKLKKLKRSHYFLAAVITICFMLQQYSVRYYNSVDRFYEFNAERAKITDYGTHERLNSEQLSAVLKQSNWSNNDLRMINNWFFYDSNVYSLENIAQFTKLCGTGLKEFKLSKVYLIDDIKENKYLFLLMLLFMFLLILKLGLSKGDLIYIILSLCIILGLLVFMFFYMRNPPMRIFFPCVNFLVITPMLFFQQKEDNKTLANWRKKVLSAFVVLFFCISILFMYKSVKVSNENTERYTYLKDFKTKNEYLTNYFIFDWGGFPYDRVLPIEREGVSSYLEKDMKVLSLGTFQRTNDAKKMLSANNISDVYKGLLKDKSCVFINAKASNKRLVYLKKYYEEHLGVIVTADTLIKERDFYAFKIVELPKDTLVSLNSSLKSQ